MKHLVERYEHILTCFPLKQANREGVAALVASFLLYIHGGIIKIKWALAGCSIGTHPVLSTGWFISTIFFKIIFQKTTNCNAIENSYTTTFISIAVLILVYRWHVEQDSWELQKKAINPATYALRETKKQTTLFVQLHQRQDTAYCSVSDLMPLMHFP